MEQPQIKFDYKVLPPTRQKLRGMIFHWRLMLATLLILSLIVTIATAAWMRNTSTTTNTTSPGENVAQLVEQWVSIPLALPPLDSPQQGTEPMLTTVAERIEEWQQIDINPGDTLSSLLQPYDIAAETLHQILRLGNPIKPLKRLLAGTSIRIRMDNNELMELHYQYSPETQLIVEKTGDRYHARQERQQHETRVSFGAGTIQHSLFEAAQSNGISDQLTMELANVFAYDIDFALDIRPGDHFQVIFEEKYLRGEKIKDGVILAASFNNHGKLFHAIRYTDPAGNTDYYSLEGIPLRKAFIRTPVKFSHISSRFTKARFHPVLNTLRAHHGVDYAAATGTPIKATGQGRVQFKGRKGGYGNTIILQHGEVHTTLYAHLSAFAKNISPGTRVRQGQIIGYIGSSGLATGPHLHYEFRVNGAHRDPLTVKLPRSEPLKGRYRQDFLAKSEDHLSQLRLIAGQNMMVNIQ